MLIFRKLSTPNSHFMDVITPPHRPIQGARSGDLFILDLDSKAYEVGNNILLVYGPTHEDESWLGDHRVISKTVFAAEALTNMVSLMIFGVPRETGITKIHAFLQDNSQRQDVRCCFVCARSIKREREYYPWPSKLRRTPDISPSVIQTKELQPA